MVSRLLPACWCFEDTECGTAVCGLRTPSVVGGGFLVSVVDTEGAVSLMIVCSCACTASTTLGKPGQASKCDSAQRVASRVSDVNSCDDESWRLSISLSHGAVTTTDGSLVSKVSSDVGSWVCSVPGPPALSATAFFLERPDDVPVVMFDYTIVMELQMSLTKLARSQNLSKLAN